MRDQLYCLVLQVLILVRDQDELRYSVRSVLQALPGSIGAAHIIVADYPYDPAVDERLLLDNVGLAKPQDRSSLRIAQVPYWLDFANVGCSPKTKSEIILQLVTHSDIFHIPSEGTPGEMDIEDQWRQNALPSFNSKAIESRIGWVPGLVCDVYQICVTVLNRAGRDRSLLQ